jgi:hypothetical protein
VVGAAGVGVSTKTHTIIPAYPDWTVCTRYKDGEQNAWHDEPIIAWEIEREDRPSNRYAGARSVTRAAMPITADPMGFREDADEDWAIQRPDGRFYTVEGAVFDTKRELIDYWKECEAAAAQVAVS